MPLQSFSGSLLEPINTLSEFIYLLVKKFDVHYTKYGFEDARRYWKQSDIEIKLRDYSKRSELLQEIFKNVCAEDMELTRILRERIDNAEPVTMDWLKRMMKNRDYSGRRFK